MFHALVADVPHFLAALSLALSCGPASTMPGAQLPTIEATTTWGCEQCAGAELFGDVNDVTVTGEGTVFVLDSFAPVVRRFARDGEAAAFGAKGQGPGEFQSATTVGVVGDGMIEVFDTRQRRVSRLDFDGNELSTRPLSQFPIARSYAADQGGWYVSIIDFQTFSSTIKLWPDGDTELRTLRPVDWPLDDEGEPSDYFAFAARPGGGFALGDGNLEYRIRLYDAAGGPERDLVRDIERVAKTDEELRVEQERRDAESSRRAAMIAAEGGSASGLTPPAIDPMKRFFYINALRYDETGRLWVLTGRGGVDHAVFDLFSAENEYLGEITVPAHVERYDIAGEWLVTSGISANEYPVVRLWRIRR